MLTRVFKDRSPRERGGTEQQALAELLASRELRGHTLIRHCEIGPFAVEYLFPQQSLIVELASESVLAEGSPAARRQALRAKFFNDMGYAMLAIDPRELTRQPRRALARLQAALGHGR